MSENPKEGLDRRDFMIASIATVGASAVTRNVGPANAQETAASTGEAASSAPQGTVYTADVIRGKKVVSLLDVNDLEPGRKHFLYFKGVEMPTGQHWYVSVTVAKGAKPGKRGVLTSGVHGDEMSSVHAVQTV
ncbi:MAG TPA: peptidase M14, partial [Aestuariivirgaceae bacterium]